MNSLSFIQIIFISPILVYQNCMDDYSTDCQNNGWSDQGGIIDCSGKYVIGKYGQTEKIQKTFHVPPNHKLRFNISLYKIDSWDLVAFDGVDLFENGKLLNKFSSDLNIGTHLCPQSQPEVDWPDTVLDYSGEFTDESSEITITQQGHFDQSIIDESWGFRSVSLEVMAPCVNFYSECNYTGDLYQICSGEHVQEQRSIIFPIKSFKMVSGTQVTLSDPNYHSGQPQTYTGDQSCLQDYQFPKLVREDE